MNYNLISFIKRHIAWIIVVILSFFFGIIITIIKKDFQDVFQKKYDETYFSIIGKRKFKETKDTICKELYNVTNDEDLIKEFKFCNSIDIGTEEYGILKVNKFEDEKRRQESFILQVPLASAFYNERGALELKYRNSLFDALSSEIALNLKREDIFRTIKEKAEEDKRLEEFNQLRSILKDFNKRDLLINEMRRRYISERRDIGIQSQKELSKLIVGMSKEKVSVICVDIYSKKITKKSIEDALFKSKYDSVYLFARDGYIKILDKAIEELEKSRIMDIDDDGEYEWNYRSGKIGTGKTVIIKKKEN